MLRLPRRIPGVLLAVALVLSGSAEDLSDRVVQLSAVRRKMAATLTHMPDYTCLATTRREIQKRKSNTFQFADTLRYEIAHDGNTELWAWPGADHFQDTPITSIVQNGAIGLGDFAVHARNVFVNANGTVKFSAEEKLNGVAVLRWDFQAPPFLSKWEIGSGPNRAIAGVEGSFWANAETLEIVRLEARATDLPFNFPITGVTNVINYAPARIGTTPVLLPQTAVLLVRDSAGELHRNTTEFSHCKQYSGNAVLSFKSPDAELSQRPEPVKEVALPAGVRIRIKLAAPIESAHAVVGDLIEGIVDNDVTRGNQLLPPKGGHVTGRLRRLEKHDEGPFLIVGIELDDVSWPGHHARFLGTLTASEPEPAGFQWSEGSQWSEESIQFKNGMRGTDITIRHGMRVDAIPGVGTFFMPGSSFRINKGTVLVWETQTF